MTEVCRIFSYLMQVFYAIFRLKKKPFLKKFKYVSVNQCNIWSFQIFFQLPRQIFRFFLIQNIKISPVWILRSNIHICQNDLIILLPLKKEKKTFKVSRKLWFTEYDIICQVHCIFNKSQLFVSYFIKWNQLEHLTYTCNINSEKALKRW